MAFILNLSFDGLKKTVQKMGAKQTTWKSSAQINLVIDQALQEGIEVEDGKLEDLIEISEDGLLLYKGKLITLHIRERYEKHGWSIKMRSSAEIDIKDLPRFHIADCKTLKDMFRNKRGDRYVMSHNVDGEFQVRTSNDDKKYPLRVCMNCLTKLNYKGFREFEGNALQRENLVKNFILSDFFDIYGPKIKKKARYSENSYPEGGGEKGYTNDFTEISRNYREGQNWKCEQCGKDYRNNSKDLHTHHVNGVRGDNSPNNLKALCSGCHRAQPYHGHMR